MSKLMGYDYEIIYKQGKENVVADGLSRINGAQLLNMTLSTLHSDLLADIKNSWTQDTYLQQLIQSLSSGQQHSKYSWQQGILYRKGKIVVAHVPTLREHLMKLFHVSALGGHSGVEVTKKRLAG